MQGPKGSRGRRGPRGTMGRKGSRGDRGKPGPHGKQGNMGPLVQRENGEFKEFGGLWGYPVQRENPGNPFHLPP